MERIISNKVAIMLATALFAGCTLIEEINHQQASTVVYSAAVENVSSKVLLDSDLTAHWTSGDEISLFATTFNAKYKFEGQTGDTQGDFSIVGDLQSGDNLSSTYAVYPYSSETSITSDSDIVLKLPSTQYYSTNSYGLGANTMIAVAESKSSTKLYFKNLCGFIVVRLYGGGFVKSITLTGNNGEKIAGQATVNAAYGQSPMVTMSESATTSITLDCGEGVELGNTPEDATDFWFTVPPVTFSKGFTIRVTNTDLWSMEKSTSTERIVIRNIKNSLAPITVSYNITSAGNIEFEDANFKAYCVQNFDKNGDDEISKDEALQIEKIIVITDSISSLKGIEYFKNLSSLKCVGSGLDKGLLTYLDVSSNTALTNLQCRYNQLTTLIVNNCSVLSNLDCRYNQLSSLCVNNNKELTVLLCDMNPLPNIDVSNNLLLESLGCSSIDLSFLDVSKNTSLKYLSCRDNHLSSLDVSYNTKLITLDCGFNQISSLNVSHNTALSSLTCDSNVISALDMSNNPELTSLDCSLNQITSLNVESCSMLSSLQCIENKLAALDVSSCTALSYLRCMRNNITVLDMSNNTLLETLKCDSNKLVTLNVSNCENLTDLNCGDNELTTIDVSQNTALTALRCSYNSFKTLDISNNAALTTLYCHHNPYLTEIWLKKGQTLKTIQYDTNIATIKYKD